MALAELEGNLITVRGKAEELRYVSRIPGAKRRPDGVWAIPATLDTCTELNHQHIPMSDELSAFGNRQWKIQRYIEHVKLQTEKVEPLQPVPIKAPYTLYQHQIKAYNIALALFGRGARKEPKA